MLRAISIIILILLQAVSAAGVIQQSDRLFSYGEDPARDRQALDALQRLIQSESSNYQLQWRASRASYYIGEDTVPEQKIAHFERGVIAGQRAVALEANAAEGHFWLGANYGGVSEQKGMFKALTLIKRIRAEMETVVRLNPGYEDGKAFLALGELDRQLPRILGGSVPRAISYCEEGLKLAPGNLELKLSLARAYLESGRRDEARRQLQEVVSRAVNPTRSKAEQGVQDEARRLLGKL